MNEPEQIRADHTAQPLRSVSLEFTPDGAQDVRVRLSERAGDVHISVHSTDPALTDRLRDGVQNLAGALNSAGYDADAWAGGQGRREQRQPEEPRQPQAPAPQNPTQDDFSGMMLHQSQEAL